MNEPPLFCSPAGGSFADRHSLEKFRITDDSGRKMWYDTKNIPHGGIKNLFDQVVLLNTVPPTVMAAFLYPGAAKTGAYYSVAPFLWVLFGILLLQEQPGVQFYVGLIMMVAATMLMARDTISLQHTHEYSHTHQTIEDHDHAHAL